jgi:hypothetical protein
MQRQTIRLADFPEIKRVIQVADPSYKKRTATIVVREKVTLHGTFWSGGSRSTYTAVEFNTGKVVPAPQYDPPAFGGPQQAPTVTIPDGVVIVETGFSCGHVMSATVNVNPKNATISLPGAST